MLHKLNLTEAEYRYHRFAFGQSSKTVFKMGAFHNGYEIYDYNLISGDLHDKNVLELNALVKNFQPYERTSYLQLSCFVRT